MSRRKQTIGDIGFTVSELAWSMTGSFMAGFFVGIIMWSSFP